jgi:hypothetical protein
MKRALILVEGPTENEFVERVLRPHLHAFGVDLASTIVVTKRVKAGASFRGGITKYEKVRNDLRRLFGDSSAACITTMIDYYGLPPDFPGMDGRPPGDCTRRIEHLEAAFADDIAEPRFVPYLCLHEFEALMFADPMRASWVFERSGVAESLVAISAGFPSPEHINEGRETAPSKRILSIFPEYRKPLHGPLAVEAIGLDAVRVKCPRFGGWLSYLENLGR